MLWFPFTAFVLYATHMIGASSTYPDLGNISGKTLSTLVVCVCAPVSIVADIFIFPFMIVYNIADVFKKCRKRYHMI